MPSKILRSLPLKKVPEKATEKGSTEQDIKTRFKLEKIKKQKRGKKRDVLSSTFSLFYGRRSRKASST